MTSQNHQENKDCTVAYKMAYEGLTKAVSLYIGDIKACLDFRF